MNGVKQAVFLLLALFGLACSGYYFALSPATHKLDNETLAQTPDTIINNLVVHQFDEKGMLVQQLKTPEMTHVPNQNTHFFKTPEVIISQEGKPDWQINSQKAVATKGGEQITFINQVVIHQQATEQTQESTLRTDELTYYPKKKLATSKIEVAFERPGSVVHSVGMRAYLDKKTVKLLSRARATYEPEHA